MPPILGATDAPSGAICKSLAGAHAHKLIHLDTGFVCGDRVNEEDVFWQIVIECCKVWLVQLPPPLKMEFHRLPAAQPDDHGKHYDDRIKHDNPNEEGKGRADEKAAKGG